MHDNDFLNEIFFIKFNIFFSTVIDLLFIRLGMLYNWKC